MVERVTQDKPLPSDVLDQITSRTDGVPLFIEELTKTVLESGLLKQENGQYVLAGPLPPFAIPTSLEASLMARLDRLASVKDVAQTGAAIGREFSYELLRHVMSLQEIALNEALERLVESELIHRKGTPPDATYSFKHALVQEAAYGTLLRGRRQQLHARIASVLEEHFSEATETQPGLLARHCAQAGLINKAAEYWLKAGQLAFSRSAMTEAISQLSKGLESLRRLPDGPDARRMEIDLQITLGAALESAKGWGSPEMGKAYSRAGELCAKAPPTRRLFSVLAGLYRFHINRAEYDLAQEAAEEYLGWAQQHPDQGDPVDAYRLLGITLMFRGQFRAVLAYLEPSLVVSVPPDPRARALNFAAWTRLFQGHLDDALWRSRESLTAAQEHSHPQLLAFALHVSCLFHQVRGDRQTVHDRATALVAVAREHGFPHFVGTGTFFLSWAAMVCGRMSIDSAIAGMREGLAAKRATGAEIKVPYYLGLIADAQRRAGQREEALELLADALERVERTGERWFEAELHRLRGEAVLAIGVDHATEADGLFRRALSVAQEQGAKLWELRASIGLARLWRDQGKHAEARDLLVPVYGWFSEGFDTPDLQEAKALLDDLRSEVKLVEGG
jgi:tetratricopeptide (TPR) repeat protein